MSLEKFDAATGDTPVNAGQSVSLADFANFATLTQSSRDSDVTSLGFPDLALNVEDLINRCRAAGPDAGSCVKSVRRQIA